MSMIYELWDTETGNVVAEFDSEDAALAAVLEAVDFHGDEFAECYSLLAASEDGTSRGVAAGQALVDLARRRSEAASAG